MQIPSRALIINLTAALEGALLLLAAAWIYFARIPLLSNMQFSAKACFIGLMISFGTTAFSVLALTLGKGLPVLKDLKKMSEEILAPMVAVLGILDIVFISLVSGFCEEVLFRGVVQAQIGLLPASLFFGLFHDPTLRHKSYVLFTMVAGIVLGFLYQQTGNLWSSISAHCFHNFFSLIILRLMLMQKQD